MAGRERGTDRAVNQGWRVILFDVRGMGFSDRHVADVELAGRVLDVEGGVDRDTVLAVSQEEPDEPFVRQVKRFG
jgi:pimeloyl-ACP methyl ester carboxylesterase